MEDVDFIRAFYALFNTLIALGSLYTREGSTGISPLDQSKGNAFFERAENLMSQKANGNDNLVSVQVHILMAQYLQTTGKVNKCWVAVGTAIRIAQGIGIHLCPSSESQAHLQERRRTWSYCIQMDRFVNAEIMVRHVLTVLQNIGHDVRQTAYGRLVVSRFSFCTCR